MSDPLKTVGMVSALFDIMCEGDKDQAKVIEQRARFYKTQKGIIWPDDWDDLPLEEKKRNKELVQYFIGFLALFSIVSFISYYRRNLKKFKLDIDENQQFTSFPSDHHPVVINGLIYRELTLGPTGSGILSTLFELGSLKKISIEVIEKGKWFKSKRAVVPSSITIPSSRSISPYLTLPTSSFEKPFV